MPQSEMEALLQLQKETIESLRQLVESQRLTIEQMAKSHEEQTAQLNQTIANLNETVEYLKKRLFSSSSEKIKKNEFPGQMDLFNEAEAAAEPSVPEPSLNEAVSGYNRQPKKPKASREEILAGLPVIEVPCTVPVEDRNCPYCNTPMEVIGKKVVREELRITRARVERIQYQVPYICYNNMGLEEEDADMDANRVGEYLLKLTKNNGGLISSFHDIYSKKEEYEQNLKLLEYDILSGKQYLYEENNPYTVQPMEYGLEDMFFTEVKTASDGILVIDGGGG